MEINKNWRDWAVWFVLAALSVFVIPFLLPYIDNALMGNPYVMVVKIVVVGLIFAFVSMFLYEQMRRKGSVNQ